MRCHLWFDEEYVNDVMFRIKDEKKRAAFAELLGEEAAKLTADDAWRFRRELEFEPILTPAADWAVYPSEKPLHRGTYEVLLIYAGEVIRRRCFYGVNGWKSIDHIIAWRRK